MRRQTKEENTVKTEIKAVPQWRAVSRNAYKNRSENWNRIREIAKEHLHRFNMK